MSDGVLPPVWLIAGAGVAAALVVLGTRRMSDREIALAGILSAAFFAASSLHIRLGPTSVHPLANGLLGVLLGWRAAPAIAVGLTMQALLLGHGGLTALGVNAVVLIVPALLAGGLYRAIVAGSWWRRPGGRAVLIVLTAAAWCAVALLAIDVVAPARLETGRSDLAWVRWAARAAAVAIAAAGVIAGLRSRSEAEFALGSCVGTLCALATVGLNAVVLYWTLPEPAESVAGAMLLAHLPIAAVEGGLVGTGLVVLRRAAPQSLPAL